MNLKKVQHHLQLEVESWKKYPRTIFEGVHRTLERENPSLEGGKGARDQPSQLVFNIPDRCQDALHPKFTEVPGLCAEETKMNHFPDFSKNSCPTLFEECQSDKKMHHNIKYLEAYHHDVPLAPKNVGKKHVSEQKDLTWPELKKKDEFVNPMEKAEKNYTKPQGKNL